jgi:hypothetical protein
MFGAREISPRGRNPSGSVTSLPQFSNFGAGLPVATAGTAKMNEKRSACAITKWSHPVPDGQFCLECAAIFGHLPLTICCRLGAIQEQ